MASTPDNAGTPGSGSPVKKDQIEEVDEIVEAEDDVSKPFLPTVVTAGDRSSISTTTTNKSGGKDRVESAIRPRKVHFPQSDIAMAGPTPEPELVTPVVGSARPVSMMAGCMPQVIEKAMERAHRALSNVEEFVYAVWGVVSHHSLPDWLKDNDFLLSGHRPQLNSYWACFKSIFRIHTETGNIWTHLLGTLFSPFNQPSFL